MSIENIVMNTTLLNATQKISEELYNVNDKTTIGNRIGMIIVILSWYFYGKYSYVCFKGLVRHKNYNFLFPLTATLFAFVNNTNDVYNFIYHAQNCKPFYVLFTASATLNWAPISWLQAYRLALISHIYLPKKQSIAIISIAVILSTVYCYFYFCNLINFRSDKNENGCAVKNESNYTIYIMVSDIVDSLFSMLSICIIIYKSINHLRELNTHNEKLNSLVGQGIIELIIIALAKIILYPIIYITGKFPGYDFVWDILSIIVIISAYNLVNFPYEQSDLERRRRNNIRKNVFKFFDSSINSGSNNDSARRVSNTVYAKNDTSFYYNNNISMVSGVRKDGFNPSYKFNSMDNNILFSVSTNIFNDVSSIPASPSNEPISIKIDSASKNEAPKNDSAKANNTDDSNTASNTPNSSTKPSNIVSYY